MKKSPPQKNAPRKKKMKIFFFAHSTRNPEIRRELEEKKYDNFFSLIDFFSENTFWADSCCNESEISCLKFRHPTKGIGKNFQTHKKQCPQKKSAPKKKKSKIFFLAHSNRNLKIRRELEEKKYDNNFLLMEHNTVILQ